jgi:methionyl-tRNA synthetase
VRLTQTMRLRMAFLLCLAGSVARRVPVKAYIPSRLSRSFATASSKGSSTTTALASSSIIGTPPTPVDDGMSPFEITTPIYYVNDKPHIGHAYTSTACDVIARFMRLSGREVFFLSGTDEHGQKVEQSAEKKGVDPQTFVDEGSVNFRELLHLLKIWNDFFIRTTDAVHKKSVQVKLVGVCHLCNAL